MERPNPRQYNTPVERPPSFHGIFTAPRKPDPASRELHCSSLFNRMCPLASMSAVDKKPRIAVGSDHAGFALKEAIRSFLISADYPVLDQGTHSEESVDYPDFGKAVAQRVTCGEADFGIVVCGSGIGISIAANKIAGIRAALAHDLRTACLAREHNNANILALGGRILTEAQAIEMVQVFLSTPYAGGRHQRRLDKIVELEKR